MVRLIFAITLSSIIFSLSACTVSHQGNAKFVPPGKVFAGPLLNVSAPNSEGWQQLESSPSGMTFARKGEAPGESFAARVTRFDPPQTDSPEEFENLIVQGAIRDAETERFSTKQFSHQYISTRGYPCVQMKNISEDRLAQIGSNNTTSLILENEHLYCRHPTKKDLGFAITFSHRGKNLYSAFATEAQSFIDGVQVPSASLSK